MKAYGFIIERRYRWNGEWSEPIPDEKSFSVQGKASEWENVRHPIYRHFETQERWIELVPADRKRGPGGA